MKTNANSDTPATKPAAHTPGPWRYLANSPEFGGGPTVESDFGPVVHMPTPEDDEGQANARLIAAAPEMLAALRDAETELTEMLRLFERRTLPDRARMRVCCIRDDIRAAIARAEGRA